MTMTRKYPDPINDKPTANQLQKWFAKNAGCEATDGCWDELDGICEHGFPSWLCYLGFVTPPVPEKLILSQTEELPESTIGKLNAERQLRMTSDQLEDGLRYFTGTTVWFRHALVREMTYTEGVRFFAENGGEQGSFRFLDLVATEVFPLLERSPFLGLELAVRDNTAILTVINRDGLVLLERTIDCTDLQEGRWRFYLDDNILLLPREYFRVIVWRGDFG